MRLICPALALLLVPLSLPAQTGGGASGSRARVTVSHRDISRYDIREVRLDRGRDVWVVITDANTLIYSYSLGEQPFERDEALIAIVRKLLGVVSPPERVAFAPIANDTVAAVPPPPTPIEEFTELADAVFATSEQLLAVIEETDLAATAAAARDAVRRTLATLPLRAELLYADTLLKAEIARRFARLSAAEQAEVAVTRRVVDDAASAIINLHRRIRQAHFGELALHHQIGEGDGGLVELNISSKLGDVYTPRRWTGTGKDVAVAHLAFPRFAWTGGLAGVFKSAASFTLERRPSSTAGADSFTVKRAQDARLGIMPVGLLTYQFPCCWTSGAVLGLTGGVGLSGDAVEEINTGTDLLFGGTFGLDWARLSLLTAYTSEVVELVGAAEGDVVTDPNVLARSRTRRIWRPAVAFTITF